MKTLITIITSTIFVLGMSQTACVQTVTKEKQVLAAAPSPINPYLLTAQAIHEASCNYARVFKNGNSLADHNNTMYYCTKLGAPTIHTKMRLFEDGSFYRQDQGQAEAAYTHSSDIDPCYFNLNVGSVIHYDFYGMSLNGAKEMTGFQEFKISGSTQTDWSCVITTNAAI